MKKLLLLFAALLFAANASADVVIDQTTFPDANFRYYVRSQSYGSDGVLTDAEIAEVKSMYPWYRDIEDLTGIEYFTELETLDVGGNLLAEVDLSQNTKMKRLSLDNNLLTSVDVSLLPDLEFLSCYENQLTGIDISNNLVLNHLNIGINPISELSFSTNNSALETLYCYTCNLTSLDVSNLTGLKELDCTENQLTELVLNPNAPLNRIFCYENKIKDQQMWDLINSLPDYGADRDWGDLIGINPDSELEENVIYKSQVEAASAKGWMVWAAIGDWEPYEGTDPSAIETIGTNNPGITTRYNLQGQPVGSDYKGIVIENGVKKIAR